MLIAYTPAFHKIAMGLLSFIPELKDMDHLQAVIGAYEQNETERCWLWSDATTDNMIGIIGGEVSDEAILVKHISVSPSFRGEGLCYRMLSELAAQEHKLLNGTMEVSPLMAKWNQARMQQDINEDVR